MSEGHSIRLTAKDGVYSVAVVPPCTKHPVHTFASWKAARGFACGVRLMTRWPLVDQTSEGGRADGVQAQ